MMYRVVFLIMVFAVMVSAAIPNRRKKNPDDVKAATVELGRQLFFDKALSNPDGQSCTVCHAPKTSFSDPNHAAVSEGMVSGAFVNRNSQGLTYVSFIPPLTKDAAGEYHGGLFWDGRSNTLVHQLSGPFFNPAEMNNPDTALLVGELIKAPYYPMYKALYGKAKNHELTFRNMCSAIVAFESSRLFNEFTSKYDLWLEGKADLTEQEKLGMSLFQGKANCVSCHSMTPDPITKKVLFSEFGYYNLGVPRNEDNPFYTTHSTINPHGKLAIDKGLGAVVNDASQDGKFRVPTLRNVQYTSPYFHNGYAKTLREAVHFLNSRDAGDFPPPEIQANLATQRTGSLGLSSTEEDAIVAFLLCLTDGYGEE